MNISGFQKKNLIVIKTDEAVEDLETAEKKKKKTLPQNKLKETKVSKILKYLDKKNKRKRKTKALIDEEINSPDINVSNNSNIGNNKKQRKENISPNINFEYSFSPSLFIKKISSIEANDQQIGCKDTKDKNCLSCFLLPDNLKNNLNIFNKIFNKTEENQEEKVDKDSLIVPPLERTKFFSHLNRRIHFKNPLNTCNKAQEQPDKNYNDLDFIFEGNPNKDIFKIKKNYNLKSSVSQTRSINQNENQTSAFNNLSKNKNNIKNPTANESSIIKKFNFNLSLYNSNLFHIVNGTFKSQLEQTVRKGNAAKVTFPDSFSVNASVSRYGMKYKMYSIEEKEFCIDLVTKENYSLKKVSLLCEVPLKSLKRWLQVGSDRKKGGGRKMKDPELDSKLLKWYNEVRSKDKIPTASEIRRKALALTTGKDFLASKGWLEKFKKKHKILLLCRKNNNPIADKK